MSDMLTMPEWVDGPERQIPRSDCHLVSISTNFYDDHVWRALAGGVVVTAGKYVTRVWLDDEALADIIGDADYYAGFSDEDYTENRSACDSARRVMTALTKQVPDVMAKHRSVWSA